MLPPLVAACLAALVTGCSGGASPACLERCSRLGTDAEQCVRLCTSSCEELRDTYGIPDRTCRWRHDGTPE